MYKKIVFSSILFTGVILSAQAQDKIKVNLGGMLVTDFTTNIQHKRNEPILSEPINLDQDLAVDNETATFRFDGYYRFNDKHSIDFAYFAVNSKGNISLDKDLEWDDTIIAVGGEVNTNFDMDVYKLSYGYSFYHDDDLELVGSAGFHVTGIDLGLSAVGTVDGEAGETYRSSESVTLPLPVFGFRGEYRLLNNTLYTTFKAEYLYVEYDNYEGDILSAHAAIEYRFLENYGFGVGYSYNDITFKDKSDNKVLKVKNTLSGVMVYLTYIY